MKHDFREQPKGPAADRFREWLQSETVSMLGQSLGDPERTRSAIFLFVNRAYEARMDEREIGAIFGKSFAAAGHPESDEDAAFDLLELLARVAKRTHDGSPG
jgi:hypothetical protein